MTKKDWYEYTVEERETLKTVTRDMNTVLFLSIASIFRVFFSSWANTLRYIYNEVLCIETTNNTLYCVGIWFGFLWIYNFPGNRIKPVNMCLYWKDIWCECDKRFASFPRSFRKCGETNCLHKINNKTHSYRYFVFFFKYN